MSYVQVMSSFFFFALKTFTSLREKKRSGNLLYRTLTTSASFYICTWPMVRNDLNQQQLCEELNEEKKTGDKRLIFLLEKMTHSKKVNERGRDKVS